MNQGGQQQVNNGMVPDGTCADVASGQTEQNELLEVSDGKQRLDTTAAAAPAGGHRKVETVGAVKRAKNRRR